LPEDGEVKMTRVEEERVDRKRRSLLKAGIGLGVTLLLAYLLWPDLEKLMGRRGRRTSPPGTGVPGLTSFPPPTTATPHETPAPTTGPTTGPPATISPGDLGAELPGLPGGSPLGSLRPYLTLEPLAAMSSTATDWDKVHLSVQLKSSNLGGAPSSALLEVLLLEDSLTLPLNLSSLPRIGFDAVYLPPGSGVVKWYIADIPADATGVFFAITDPLLDPCPRSLSSQPEIQAEIGRHLVYYGK